MQKPSLPTNRDWAILGLLLLLGSALGFAVNALSPHGINLGLALGLGS